MEPAMVAPDSPPDTLEATLQLALIPGIGPRTCRTLIEHLGSASAVLQAAPSQLRSVPGMGPKLTRTLCEGRRQDHVARVLGLCREHQISLLLEQDDQYPRLLREIHDPPPVLFMRGRSAASDALSVAIVGSRRATPYGVRQAERLGRGLARAGVTVVSGLARGIDAAAHRGALSVGGRTVAVLAGGLLDIYPPEHRELAEQITAQAAVLSEARPDSQPRSGMFPQRNRLIAGMSLGVIVVEAALRSGALITAGHATDQGREVFAVPGRVDCRNARGCHRLLREGAKLVECVEDVLEELGPLVESAPREDGTIVRSGLELQLNAQELAVLNAVSTEPTSIDQVVAGSNLPVHRVLATLSVLEMRRLVKRISGSFVARA
jgi:DNA processing protein